MVALQTQSDQATGFNIDLKGEQKALRRITPGFYVALENLLRKAGFNGGRFVVNYQRMGKGTAHTHGLRLRSPSAFGVTFTWHEGSNDNCFTLSIRSPNGMEHHAFYARLKEALSLGESQQLREYEQPPSADEVSESQTDHSTGKILPDLKFLPKKEEDSTESIESVSSVSDSVAQPMFADDEQNVELFLIEAVRLADLNGQIMVEACTHILKRDFQKKGTSSIVRSLIARGHLLETGDTSLVQIAPHWLAKFRPQFVSQPKLVDKGEGWMTGLLRQAAQETASMTVVPMSVESALSVMQLAPASAEAGSIASMASAKLQALEDLAISAAPLQKVIDEADADLEKVVQQIMKLQEQRVKLEQTRAEAERMLAETGAGEAVAKLAALKKMLDSL